MGQHHLRQKPFPSCHQYTRKAQNADEAEVPLRQNKRTVLHTKIFSDPELLPLPKRSQFGFVMIRICFFDNRSSFAFYARNVRNARELFRFTRGHHGKLQEIGKDESE